MACKDALQTLNALEVCESPKKHEGINTHIVAVLCGFINTMIAPMLPQTETHALIDRYYTDDRYRPVLNSASSS